MHAFGDIETNVAEGYPRFDFTASQQAIVDRLPAFMAEANRVAYSTLEARAQRSLLDAVGQATAPIGTGRILSYYAAGVAIDIIGRCLAQRTKRGAVIHPTLDCLPALIRSRGVEVVPFNEARMNRRDPLEGLDGVGGLYIANPNNPTGTVIDPRRLRRLADSCPRSKARRASAPVTSCTARSWNRRMASLLCPASTLLSNSQRSWRRSWVMSRDGSKAVKRKFGAEGLSRSVPTRRGL